MIGAGEKEILINHILESKENLEIAIDIQSYFEEIRKRIIIDFIKAFQTKIEIEIKKWDGEWMINNKIIENPFQRNNGFYIFGKGWINGFSIGFEPWKYAAYDYIVCVKRNKDKYPQPIEGEVLKTRLDQKCGNGAVSAGWDEWYYDWYRYLPSDKYGNWSQEVLIDLYEKDEAIDFFKERLFLVKEVASPIIDQWINSKTNI